MGSAFKWLALLLAGNWNNTSNAGCGAMNWTNNRTNSNNNVGFALDCGFTSNSSMEIVERQGCVVRPWAKSAKSSFLVAIAKIRRIF